jgi:DinB superfamily
MTTTWDATFDQLRRYAASDSLSRPRLLLAHLDYAWGVVRPRLDGLTNQEYFWEPAPDCWTVRARDDGSFVPDWAWPEPSPPPFTTIAWRATHLGYLLHMRTNHYVGDRTLTPHNAPWPGTAEAALSWIESGFNAYRGWAAGLSDADLDEHPDVSSEYLIDAQFPFAMAIQHITLEVIHHGAEISLLRGLYQARLGTT